MQNPEIDESHAVALLRLPEVLRRIPVSRPTWYRGVAEGRFPKPIKLSERVSAWRESDIDALIAKFTEANA